MGCVLHDGVSQGLVGRIHCKTVFSNLLSSPALAKITTPMVGGLPEMLHS
jgi:hypothetical protein